MKTCSYTLTKTWKLLRDQPVMGTPLTTLFRDSHAVFRVRIQQLGTVSRPTTTEDSEILRLMLETLIETKQKLQNQA